jgi:two-component system, OmpR family, response regulator BaeR
MSIDIYIIEDEPELASVVADYVRAAGYAPTVFADGAVALQALRDATPALVVLDLMLPGLDGLSLCRALREFSDVPVVMVTARVEEIDRLLGLEAGADDYVCKPFSPREVVARIKAILRRSGPASQPSPVALDESARRAAIHGKPLDLTPSEFALLAVLARRPGQVFSRAQLLDLAFSDSMDVTDRVIDSHIKNLRRKIDTAAPGMEPIHSIYGLGYRFDL